MIDIKQSLLRHVLMPGDQVINKDGRVGTFKKFSEIWYGRIPNPGCIPGKYLDRSKIIVESAGKDETWDSFVEPANAEVLNRNKPDNWYQLDYQGDSIGIELPQTALFEGDVAAIVNPQHPHFTPNIGKNQFTVYRINYETKTYKLRAGKLVFEAQESDLRLLAAGTVRIWYNGESFQLAWRSLKDEAEFYLLIGRYQIVFNQKDFNYCWKLEEARSAIMDGKIGDGILLDGGKYYLVKFLDKHLADQVSGDPALILDI